MADASAREICELFNQRQRLTESQLSRTLGRTMPGAMDEMVSNGLLVRSGLEYLSTNALERSLILADGINSGDIDYVISRLQTLYPRVRKVSVVNDVTQRFLEAITRLPTAGTLAICSPWIRLSEDEWSALEQLLHRSALRDELFNLMVVMRPPRDNDPFSSIVSDTIQRFRSMGADVITNPRVHAKLYVRVPSTSPGDELAVIGSQNMTQTSYDELGLFVDNDRELVRELYGAFFAIAEGRLT